MSKDNRVCCEIPCVPLIPSGACAQRIGSLHDPITWYRINYAGTQVTQWDFQNKGKSGWTGASSFGLEISLCNLRPSVINSVPCDRIVQRAYYSPANKNVSLSGKVKRRFDYGNQAL